MIKRILLSLLALCSAVSLSAQTSFLSTPNSAKSLSLAGADASYSVDGFSVLKNIAATATADNSMSVGASYLGWQPDYLSSSVASLSGYYKVQDRLSVGASFQYEALPAQSIISSTGSANGSFSPSGMSVGLGAAYAIFEELSVGLSANYISTSIYTLSGSAVGANLSLNYLSDGYSVAFVVDNIELMATDITLPTTLAVMGSTSLLASGKHSIAAMAELAYVVAPSDWSSPIAALGVEYGYNSTIFVRGGYRYSDTKSYMSDYASVGVGASLVGATLDFAYLIPTTNNSPLTGTFMVSATFSIK